MAVLGDAITSLLHHPREVFSSIMDVSPAARGTTLALSAPILLYSTFLLALTFRPIQRGYAITLQYRCCWR